MKKFLKILFLFLAFLPIIITATYFLINFYFNNKSSENTIFIWGDSQALNGIELKTLSKKTNKHILTTARAGSSVYDFIVFTEQVPYNSEVIVQISKPVQIRPKENDNNKSAISIIGLSILKKNNYSFSEIISIIKKNRIPKKVFYEKTYLRPYNKEITIGESITLFEEMFKEIPSYLKSKQEIILQGIQKLKEKNCAITFLEFPFHPIVQKIEDKSPIKHETDEFKYKALSLFKEYKIDTIKIDNTKELMYDLTHLNETGAIEVSAKLGMQIHKNDCTTLYIIHWRD